MYRYIKLYNEFILNLTLRIYYITLKEIRLKIKNLDILEYSFFKDRHHSLPQKNSALVQQEQLYNTIDKLKIKYKKMKKMNYLIKLLVPQKYMY